MVAMVVIGLNTLCGSYKLLITLGEGQTGNITLLSRQMKIVIS